MVPKFSPTRPARQVWRHLFGSRLPKGWSVRWARAVPDAFAVCDLELRLITLDWHEAHWRGGHCVADLIHEYVHLNHPQMEHGKAFEEIVTAQCAKLGIINSREKRSTNGNKGRKEGRAARSSATADASGTPEEHLPQLQLHSSRRRTGDRRRAIGRGGRSPASRTAVRA